MNFALPAVLVILGLIPGILFYKGYFSGKFPREIASDSPINEFATYFLFALPIDAAGLNYLSLDQRKAAFKVILDLSISSLGDSEINQAVDIFSESWLQAALLYFALCGMALAAGMIVRRLVWTFRLDVGIPSLRMKSDYYYILQGRVRGFPRKVLPHADILAGHPSEGSRLYRGIVTQFSFTTDGEIKELVLADAHRGKGRTSEFEWKRIPSNQFVLLGRNIHSVNMRYFGIRPEQPNWPRRLWRWVVDRGRSFVLEEP